MSYEQPTIEDTGDPAPYGNVFVRNQGSGNVVGYYNERSGWTIIAFIGSLSYEKWKAQQQPETREQMALRLRRENRRERQHSQATQQTNSYGLPTENLVVAQPEVPAESTEPSVEPEKSALRETVKETAKTQENKGFFRADNPIGDRSDGANLPNRKSERKRKRKVNGK